MAQFNPQTIKAASKSAEFAQGTKARDSKALLATAIDHQVTLFKDAKQAGKRWFTIGQTETLVRLRYTNKALVLKDGEASVVVPNGQLEAALAYFREQVVKGAYDEQLTAMEKARDARTEKMRKTKAGNKA